MAGLETEQGIQARRGALHRMVHRAEQRGIISNGVKEITYSNQFFL
jgi:hypothetical protein